jgi:small subunit ribosomal protein S1
LESAAPVEGTVVKAVKAGLEINIGGVRAFCPSSQVERTYTEDLEAYVGQTFRCRVLEVKDDGRSVIVSRKALLLAEAQSAKSEALSRLRVGEDLEGTVVSIQKFGAFVDVGGVEGLVHISELSTQRVERVEDVLEVGERVRVRLQKITETEPGQPRIELSMKALVPIERSQAPERNQVVTGTVAKAVPGGILVDTERGTGLVPARELGLPRGADHRRAFPVGKEVRVVVLNQDSGGKLSFSISKVAAVEERQNYANYGHGGSASSGKLGSFGELLRAKLGLPEPEPEPQRPAPTSPVSPPQAEPQAEASRAPSERAKAPPTVSGSEDAPLAASRTFVDQAPKPKAEAPVKSTRKPGELPDGIVRRRKGS